MKFRSLKFFFLFFDLVTGSTAARPEASTVEGRKKRMMGWEDLGHVNSASLCFMFFLYYGNGTICSLSDVFTKIKLQSNPLELFSSRP